MKCGCCGKALKSLGAVEIGMDEENHHISAGVVGADGKDFNPKTMPPHTLMVLMIGREAIQNAIEDLDNADLTTDEVMKIIVETIDDKNGSAFINLQKVIDEKMAAKDGE